MPTQFKSAGEALYGASPKFNEWENLNKPDRDYYEQVAQTFLASEWGESETLCSECGQRGTHRTEDCPFPKTPLLFAEMESEKGQPQPPRASVADTKNL